MTLSVNSDILEYFLYIIARANARDTGWHLLGNITMVSATQVKISLSLSPSNYTI